MKLFYSEDTLKNVHFIVIKISGSQVKNLQNPIKQNIRISL